MRFSSGRNVESCAEEHSPGRCQAAWAGMNSGCYKSPLCLLQQPQKVQNRTFHEASQTDGMRPTQRSPVLESMGTPHFLSPFPRSFSDWPFLGLQTRKKVRISVFTTDSFVAVSGEIFYDMAKQTLVL